jgi:hypothetical protein
VSFPKQSGCSGKRRQRHYEQQIADRAKKKPEAIHGGRNRITAEERACVQLKTHPIL